MKLALFVAILAASMLPACTTVGEMFGHSPSNLPQGRCQAAGAKSVLGHVIDDRLVNEALMGSGAMRSRTIRQRDPIPIGVDPMRLTLEVDQTGRVRRLSCG